MWHGPPRPRRLSKVAARRPHSNCTLRRHKMALSRPRLTCMLQRSKTWPASPWVGVPLGCTPLRLRYPSLIRWRTQGWPTLLRRSTPNLLRAMPWPRRLPSTLRAATLPTTPHRTCLSSQRHTRRMDPFRIPCRTCRHRTRRPLAPPPLLVMVMTDRRRMWRRPMLGARPRRLLQSRSAHRPRRAAVTTMARGSRWPNGREWGRRGRRRTRSDPGRLRLPTVLAPAGVPSWRRFRGRALSAVGPRTMACVSA